MWLHNLYDFLGLGARSQSSLFTVKKREHTKPRSKSKSPRNSRIIPGVRISELKLIPSNPTSPKGSDEKLETKEIDLEAADCDIAASMPQILAKIDQNCPKKQDMTLELEQKSEDQMAVSEIWADESPNVPNAKLAGKIY